MRVAARGRGHRPPRLLVSFDEINNLMGLPQLRALEDRHLSTEDRERKYGKAATQRAGSGR